MANIDFSEDLKEKAKENLLSILRAADLVKFAKMIPMPDANMRAMESAYKFIDFTKTIKLVNIDVVKLVNTLTANTLDWLDSAYQEFQIIIIVYYFKQVFRKDFDHIFISCIIHRQNYNLNE